MKLKLNTTVKYNGKIHKAGEVIDVSQENVEEMKAYGEFVEYLSVSPSPEVAENAPEQPNKAVNDEGDTNTPTTEEKAVKKANTKSVGKRKANN